MAVPRIPDAPRFDSEISKFVYNSYPFIFNCVSNMGLTCAFGITSVNNIMSGLLDALELH